MSRVGAQAVHAADDSPSADTDVDLSGRTLYIPHMPYGGSRLLAAAFRSIDIDGQVVPHADALTLEVGGRYTCGDECYPQRVVAGDFLKLLEVERRNPSSVAFLLPTANGPCRFGQYAGLQRQILDEHGYGDVPVVSLTSADGYAGIGRHAPELLRTAWRALVASDVLMKLLLMTRPYEVHPGQADVVYLDAISACEAVLEQQGVRNRDRLRQLQDALRTTRRAFRAVPVREEERPLVGVVGEIFTRLNSFANEEVIRCFEAQGAECWLAGISEWVWYTSEEQLRRLREEKRRLSRAWLKAVVTRFVQRRDERALVDLYRREFAGRAEPHVPELLDLATPYLPPWGCGGEMLLSTGGTVFFHRVGADGVVDISPFSCMNAIVTEAVYPKVSRDHDDFPVRVFYFDGTQTDLDRDVGIFLELVDTYRRRRHPARHAITG